MSTVPAIPEYEFLDLAYRPDLHVLTVRWLRAVTFAELQEGFRTTLALNEQYHAAHWLVDVRRRTELDAASSTWVATELLPQAAAALAPLPLYVAYLLSPMRAQELLQDADMRLAVDTAQAPAQPYRLQTFTDEGPAVHWLISHA